MIRSLKPAGLIVRINGVARCLRAGTLVAAAPHRFLPLPNTIRIATAADIPVLSDLMQEFHGEGAADGRAAGYIVLTLRFSMEFGGIDAFIDDLFVRPAFRRRGLARTALSALFEDCERSSVLAVHVETGHDHVPAKRLYENRGLRQGTNGRQMLAVALGNRATATDP